MEKMETLFLIRLKSYIGVKEERLARISSVKACFAFSTSESWNLDSGSSKSSRFGSFWSRMEISAETSPNPL